MSVVVVDLVNGLEKEEEEGEKRSRRLSRFRDAFVGTSTPRTSARSLGPGYILVASKSPIEFPVDLAMRNGVESKRERERELKDLSSDFPIFVVELAYEKLASNRNISIAHRNWINNVIAVAYACHSIQ